MTTFLTFYGTITIQYGTRRPPSEKERIFVSENYPNAKIFAYGPCWKEDAKSKKVLYCEKCREIFYRIQSKDEELTKLEALGEEQVKNNLANGVYASYRKERVEFWLKEKDSERRDLGEAAILAIAEEANSFAREALSIARESAAACSWREPALSLFEPAALAARVQELGFVQVPRWPLQNPPVVAGSKSPSRGQQNESLITSF